MAKTQFIIFDGMLTLIGSSSIYKNVEDENAELCDLIKDVDHLSDVHDDEDYYPTFTINYDGQSTDEIENDLRDQLAELDIGENHFAFAIIKDDNDENLLVASFEDESVDWPDRDTESMYRFLSGIGLYGNQELMYGVPKKMKKRKLKKKLIAAGMVESKRLKKRWKNYWE